ncbi:hypothetical protein CF328_g4359 [Tilletia controversa]|nr:hypothetical protein CF328_g4359 [Tilletia controversa]
MEAGHWGTSEVHVFNCVRRVVTALASLKDSWIVWPDAAARILESADSKKRAGLKGVIGKLDGTDIVLYERPGECGELNGDEFFNRKRRYAINLTAVCDRRSRFIYTLVGWPGSVHDSRAWSVSSIQREPASFFETGQFLVADSAYTNSDIVVTPYKKPLANRLPNRRFNKLLSSIRIDIEHAFGLLKGRWTSLKGLRVRLLNDSQLGVACMWITACVVLHNILIDQRDLWQSDAEQEEGGEEDDAGTGKDENESWREKVKRRALRRVYGV